MGEFPTKKNNSLTSLIERFKNAKGIKIAKIAPRELVEQMLELATYGDSNNLKALFESYLAWELSLIGKEIKGQGETQVKERALRNFDVITSLTDNLILTEGDKLMAKRLTVYGNKNHVGKVRGFFRQSIGYEPPPSIIPSSPKRLH
jgi:hypothetical protein